MQLFPAGKVLVRVQIDGQRVAGARVSQAQGGEDSSERGMFEISELLDCTHERVGAVAGHEPLRAAICGEDDAVEAVVELETRVPQTRRDARRVGQVDAQHHCPRARLLNRSEPGPEPCRRTRARRIFTREHHAVGHRSITDDHDLPRVAYCPDDGVEQAGPVDDEISLRHPTHAPTGTTGDDDGVVVERRRVHTHAAYRRPTRQVFWRPATHTINSASAMSTTDNAIAVSASCSRNR